MKTINKMIRRTIMEIVIIIALVLISIPVWETFNLNNYASVAMSYEIESYNHLEVSDYSDYVLYQVNDNDALKNIKPINLKLSNKSNNYESYAVWLIVSKNSTLDNSSVKINIDNEIKLLTELEYYEDENDYYFLMFDGEELLNEVSKDIQLWLDIDSEKTISNKYLEFSFENIQRQIL